MSECMYVCMHVCMYVCMSVCIASQHVCLCACMHACMYACMHVCMNACRHVCNTIVVTETRWLGQKPWWFLLAGTLLHRKTSLFRISFVPPGKIKALLLHSMLTRSPSVHTPACTSTCVTASCERRRKRNKSMSTANLSYLHHLHMSASPSPSWGRGRASRALDWLARARACARAHEGTKTVA